MSDAGYEAYQVAAQARRAHIKRNEAVRKFVKLCKQCDARLTTKAIADTCGLKYETLLNWRAGFQNLSWPKLELVEKTLTELVEAAHKADVAATRNKWRSLRERTRGVSA